jgi:hypothetical protein
LAVEIGDLLMPQGEVDDHSTNDRLVITCDGSLARLHGSGSDGRAPLERSLDLAGFPADVTSRALALAGLELLASLSPDVRWRVEAGHPAAPGPTSTPAPSPPVRPHAVVQADAGEVWSRIAAGGCTRTFLTANGALAWGGRVEGEREVGRRYEVAMDLEVAGASQNASPLGQVTGALVSTALMGGVRVGGRDLTGVLSFGGRIGLVRWEGHPVPGTSASGDRVLRPWGGPLVSARFHAGIGHLDLQVAAEAGVDPGIARGVADGTTVLTVGGAWLSLFAGAGIRL